MRAQKVKLQPIGLIGLGLMGRGIASCLLSRGFDVIAYNRTARRAKASVHHIENSLEELVRRKMATRARIKNWRDRFRLVGSIAELAPAPFVIESVKEDLELKHQIYEQLESAVVADAVIASNTSSLPISVLQSGRKQPARFIGMHWGEPAQIMRYLEVIPGEQTSARTVELTMEVGNRCGKEPTLLRRDIQGFISNRMMYAMIREAFYLVEAGIADIETVDPSATILDIGPPSPARSAGWISPESRRMPRSWRVCCRCSRTARRCLRSCVKSWRKERRASVTPKASTRTRKPAPADGKRRGSILRTKSASWRTATTAGKSKCAPGSFSSVAI
jgi:hypothetical protein